MQQCNAILGGEEWCLSSYVMNGVMTVVRDIGNDWERRAWWVVRGYDPVTRLTMEDRFIGDGNRVIVPVRGPEMREELIRLLGSAPDREETHEYLINKILTKTRLVKRPIDPD